MKKFTRCIDGCAYATAGRPFAPPQPINTMLKVNVAITKLAQINTVQSHLKRMTYPRNPNGVAFAYFPTLSDLCGTLGERYSFSNNSGLIDILVAVCASCGFSSIRSELELR
jgi:hypothetical protein